MAASISSKAASPTSVPDLADLHRRFHDHRDPGDRALLLDRYQGLARSLAARAATSADDLDDLVQVALLGVLSALERFDPDRNVQFTTFAWATAQGELKRYRRDRGWVVRVPRRLQEAALRTAGAIEVLNQELGHQPTISQIAERTGDPEELVIEAIEVRSARRPSSLEARRDDGGRAGAWEPSAIDGSFVEVEERSLLSSLLRRLPPREREVLQLRFVEERTQVQIAERIGCSQMQVSRLLTRAVSRLREWAEIEGRAVARRPVAAPVDGGALGVG